MASFLELVEHLIDDPAAKGAYLADPHGYLDAHGFGGFDHEDVATALHHVADAFPPRLAAHVSPVDGLDHLVQLHLHDVGLHGFDDYHEPWDHPGGEGEAHPALEHPWTAANEHEPWHTSHDPGHDAGHDPGHEVGHDPAHGASHGPVLHEVGAHSVGAHAGPGAPFDLGHDVDLDGHRADIAAHHDDPAHQDDPAHHLGLEHLADRHGATWHGWDDGLHHDPALADPGHGMVPDAAHGDLAHGDLAHADVPHDVLPHDGLAHVDLTHIDPGHAELGSEHHWIDDVLDHGHHADEIDHLVDHGPADHHDDGDLHHH